MKYLIYRTYHIETGQFAIGYTHASLFNRFCHIGSNSKLQRIVALTGKQVWKTDLITRYDNKDEALKEETKLIQKEWFNPLCVNDGAGRVRKGKGHRHYGVKGKDHPRFNVAHTDEAKELIRLAQEGKTACESTREKMRLQKLGKKNPNFGKTGKKHHGYGVARPEHSEFISNTRQGENNPIFGKKCYYHIETGKRKYFIEGQQTDDYQKQRKPAINI